LEKVAELLGALDLVLGHPRVEKLLLVLREHQSGELDALHLVEDAALQADAEILQERRRGSRLLGDRLEPRDRLGVTEDTLGGVSGALSGTLDVPGGEELLKLGLDEDSAPGRPPRTATWSARLTLLSCPEMNGTTAGSLRFSSST